jgi:hypothetical protein
MNTRLRPCYRVVKKLDPVSSILQLPNQSKIRMAAQGNGAGDVGSDSNYSRLVENIRKRPDALNQYES